MKLFVLGGTSGTGLEVVRQGLHRGHTVTVLARSPDKLSQQPGLQVIGGSISDPKALALAAAGHDVALSSVGPGNSKPTSVREDSTRALIEALRQTGVERLLVVSAALLFPNMGLVAAILNATLTRYATPDAGKADALVMANPLAWTVVRPPRLTNGAHTGRYRIAVDKLPPGGSSIARADVAHALLDIIEQRSHVRQIVGVCR